jgi:hypothetical protein
MANRPEMKTDMAKGSGDSFPMLMLSLANPKLAKTKNTASRKITEDLRGVVCQGLGVFIGSGMSSYISKMEPENPVLSELGALK